MPGSILVLTGPKNSGKSTFCRDLARAAAAAGVDVAGIHTEKQPGPLQYPNGRQAEPDSRHPAEGDRLVVTDLRTGRQAVLGRREANRWILREEGFRLGREALQAATPCHLLIVDEIGRLELRQGSGWRTAFQVLATGLYRQAVVTVRYGCTEAFQQALREADPAGNLPRIRLNELQGGYPSSESASLLGELLEPLAGEPQAAVEQR